MFELMAMKRVRTSISNRIQNRMEDSNKYIVFYSWQSDFPESRTIINDSLKAAKDSLSNSGDPLEIIIDQGTARVSGMPQIDTTILAKILNCDVFVADITPVHKEGEDLLPNANVLLELGFAMGVVGMSKIILLAKEGDWKPKDLPFDINHKRIDFFNNQKNLAGLGEWIRSSIESSKESGKSDDRMRRIEHDIKKFREFNTPWSEDVFMGSFDTISRTSHFNDYELEIWEDVRNWLSKSENQFVTKSIKDASVQLYIAINDFLGFTIKYWSSSVRWWCTETPSDEKDALRIKRQQFYEWEPEGQSYTPFYRQREEVVVNGLNQYIPKIGEAYHAFRGAVKNELYV